jgi:hypothetical protein
MTKKIDQEIVDYAVVASAESGVETSPEIDVVHMHEKLERPEILVGSTYKVKTPLSEHALYITVNDIILNPDTPHEQRQPFEIFINSKNMDHFQWVVALTRVISAVFRKGGDATFLVEELKAVFDPKGGYFKRGGRFMPSLVAEIGEVIEHHMKSIGLLPEDKLDEHQRAFLAKKKQELAGNDDPDGDFPTSAQLCGKCHTKAVIFADGCMTCLSCGDSKCS